MKRGLLFILLFLVLIIGVFAQETGEGPRVGDSPAENADDSVDDVEAVGDDVENEEEAIEIEDEADESREDDLEEIGDEELEQDAGITPDSAFYFLDEFFARFGSDLDNREEKIAEIRAMIEAGNIEAARKALENYRKYADELEREVSPEEKDETQRSSRAIRKTIRDVEGYIPDEDKDGFRGVIEKERRIETAAEIASKIRDLCLELSKLDPSEYERVCRTKDDDPEWHKKLDRQLTDEQRKEVEGFVGIMSQCFATSGRECRCEDIKISAFAAKCSVIAPLAAKCDEGDENSCEKMADIEEEGDPFDLLPDYLRDAVERIERDYDYDRIEKFAPPECKRDRAIGPQACLELMFRRNAPGQCLNALDRGEITFTNEREAREVCEEIMFRENAPPECIDVGIRDHRECGKLMFQRNAPEECIDAGLTGDSPKDMRECERIMRESGKGRGPHGFAPALGVRCKGIQNSEERLKCFDEALAGIGIEGGFEGRFGERRESPGGWPQPCIEAGATTRESCEKIMHEEGERRRREYENYYRNDFERRFEETFERERVCAEKCSGEGKAWSFSEGTCVCSGGDRFEGEFRPSEEFEGQPQPTPSFEEQQPPSGESATITTTTESSGTSGSGETYGETTTTNSEGSVTGSVIVVDNKFFDYYYN